MADDGETPSTALPVQQKKAKQQLTKGMEHLRSYVTIDPKPSTDATEGDSKESAEITSSSDAYGVPAAYEPIRQPAVAPKDNNPQKRSDPFQFGTRYLEEGDDIFAHNAWDHVEVDSHYNEFIASQTEFQRANQVSEFDKKRFNEKPEKWWDRFYGNNQANFFKDRKWLTVEFPILAEITREDYGKVTALEVGAGAGNTAFPVLAMNKNKDLSLHACDYSAKAVEVMRAQKAYVEQTEPQVMKADVWDIAGDELPPGLQAGSVDVVLMIFIFSALSPDQWRKALRNLFTLLKPGGEVMFRDYGRGDLAQVRFKKGRYLDENFYVRGDGTRVYFFEEEELRHIWSGGIFDDAGEQDNGANVGGADRPGFDVVNLGVDRRMLVNRQRKLKMYRCWMQGRFRKPVDRHHSGPIARGEELSSN